MTDPGDSLSDIPKFDRQRRNVLSASIALILIHLAGIDISKLTVFSAQIAHPIRIEAIWGVIISYFVLRMHQFRYEITQNKEELWNQYFLPRLNAVMTNLSLEYRELIEKSNKTFRGTPHDGLTLMSARRKKNRLNFRFHPFRNGDPLSVSSLFPAKDFKYGRLLWFWADIKTLPSISWNTLYFTEYLLPYFCGAIAIALVVIDLAVGIKMK